MGQFRHAARCVVTLLPLRAAERLSEAVGRCSGSCF